MIPFRSQEHFGSTIRKAIENLVAENEQPKVSTGVVRIYAELADSDRRLSEEFLRIASETLPTFAPEERT